MSEKKYWRTLQELEQDPEFEEFLRKEFVDVDYDRPGSTNRRRFMQLMGASFALAGASACRWEAENFAPYTRRPQGLEPGAIKYFASVMDVAGTAIPVKVASYDNRPYKIEPNEQHPFSRGGTDAYAQASILTMFDPDRSQQVYKGGEVSDRKAFEAALGEIAAKAKRASGKGVVVLSGESSSPSMAALRMKLLADMPQAKWVEYESLSRDNAREGARLAFGQVARTHYDLSKADVIVALGADLFGDHPAKLKHARDWAAGRRPDKSDGHGDHDDVYMNRLYVLETRFTTTGASADHRLPVRAEQMLALALALEAAVEKDGKVEGLEFAHKILSDEKVKKMVSAVAKDLVHHRGKSVVAVGHQQDPAVHAVVHRLNAALSNVGSTIQYTEEPNPDRPVHGTAIADLVRDMNADQVKTLFVLGGNPAYDAPGDLDFAAAMEKVETTVHFGLYRDKTAKLSTWHVPATHFLETWGDARTWDGLVTIQQPLIAPLYDSSMAIIEMLLVLAGIEDSPDKFVRATAMGIRSQMSAATDETAAAGGKTETVEAGPAVAAPTDDQELAEAQERLTGFLGDDMVWRKSVAQGFVDATGYPTISLQVRGFSAPTPAERVFKRGEDLENSELEVFFYDDGKVHDGRFANNGWLQETPDFTTKLTWDNAAILSPGTARRFGVTDQDMIRVSLGEKSIELPVYIMPGQAPGSIAIAVGYGRPEAGAVGGSMYWQVDTTGFDVQPLRTAVAPFQTVGASIEKTGGTYKLASTQTHWSIDTSGLEAIMKRVPELARAGTIEEYKKACEEHSLKEQRHAFFHDIHTPPLLSLFPEFEWKDGYQWGMTIDLGKCTGCNACVVSCTSENNVPIVGKEQVLVGREMHWLRIDRYFTGEAEDPTISTQPVACVHCQNAPCEQVCPVAATVHDEEGTNNMVYNRCIGTRYCANNCPYKVRRFNYYNYHIDLTEEKNKVQWLAHNPDVTVRFRGVMEKCSYCFQRISYAKTEARKEGRTVRGDEIKSACQTACPTDAITFGNINDPTSTVAKLQKKPRSYAMLAELNIKPRTEYLARITNPSEDLTPKKEGEAEGHGHH